VSGRLVREENVRGKEGSWTTIEERRGLLRQGK